MWGGNGAVARGARLLASQAGRIAVGSFRVSTTASSLAVACAVVHHAYQLSVVNAFFGTAVDAEATSRKDNDDRNGGSLLPSGGVGAGSGG